MNSKLYAVGDLVIIDYSNSYDRHWQDENMFVGRVIDVLVYGPDDREKFYKDCSGIPFPPSGCVKYTVMSKMPREDAIEKHTVAQSRVRRYNDIRHQHLREKSGAL